ncbi:MAG: hypothetical protein U0892_15360 [Pirellulales bacterium]
MLPDTKYEREDRLPRFSSLILYDRLLAFLIVVMTFSPLWPVGLTNTDDMVYSQLGAARDWDSPLTNAIGMGRFYYLYSGFLYMAPYLVKHHWYFKLLSLGPLIAIAWLLGRTVEKQTGTRGTGLLTMVIYCVGLQFYTDYYPTTAFPFAFTFSISLFLISHLQFMAFMKTRHTRHAARALVLFTIAVIPYESFLLLFSTVTALTVLLPKIARREKLSQVVRASLWELRGHVIVLALILIAYAAFTLLPTPEGFSRDHYKMSKEGLDVRQFLSAWEHLSCSSLPLSSLCYRNTRFLVDLYWNDPQFMTGFGDILRVAKLDWWLRALIAGVLGAATLSRLPQVNRRSFVGIAITGVAVFLGGPVLHALTAKYQQSVASGVYVYLPTYFSYLGFVAAAVSAIVLLNDMIKRGRVHSAWSALIGLMLGTVSLVHSFNNYHVARYQAHLSFTWTVMDQVLKSDAFQSIQEGATIYTPSLQKSAVTYDMLKNEVGDYWSDYAFRASGKRVRLIYDKAELPDDKSAEMYFLSLNKLSKDFEAIVVIAKLPSDRTDATPVADDFQLLTYSKYKEFSLSFESAGERDTPVTIEGQRPMSLEGRIFKAFISRGVVQPLVQTRVQASAVDLSSVDVSFFKPIAN